MQKIVVSQALFDFEIKLNALLKEGYKVIPGLLFTNQHLAGEPDEPELVVDYIAILEYHTAG